MRNSGRATKRAMQGVIDDIHDYSDAVRTLLDYMRYDVSSLNDDWNDSQFDRLEEALESFIHSVESRLNDMENAAFELKKKVEML